MTRDGPLGVAAASLTDEALLRELASLHRTRHDALRYAPRAALDHHDRRWQELEAEYLRRFPAREAHSRRAAARPQAAQTRTGKSETSSRYTGAPARETTDAGR